MSALLAHIKIVEGYEKHFEELSRELYQKSHEKEDCIIRYEYYRGREKKYLLHPLGLPLILRFFT